MSKIFSPKITTDGLVMCLDASNNKSYPAADLPVKDGLILWLDAADDTTFSYSSGAVVSQWRDKSGLNNHVAQSTVASQPNRNVVKNSRKSVYFDGGDTLFNSGNVFPSNTTDYTKIAVVYQTSTATTGNVISSNTDLGGGVNHAFFFNGSTNIRLFHGSIFVTSTVSLSINTIGIITGTFTYSSGDGAIYVNGSAAGTGTTANKTIPRDISIGSYVGGNNYTGEICEVLVFSKVLSATELKQVHTYLGQKWGISNTDRSIIDMSGGGYAGLLGNGTTANMPFYDYYNKGGLKFDGSNDYALCPSATVNALNGNSITVEAWIKHSSFGGISDGRTYISNWSSFNTLDQKGFILRTYVNQTFPSFWWCWGGGNNYDAQGPSSYVMNLNQIYHVVATYLKGTGLKIYINGNLEATFTTNTNNTIAFDTTNGVHIGYSPINTSYMDGNIYVARLYNRALSAAEVSQNYEAQKARFTNTIVQQGLVLNLDAGNPYSYAGSGATWYDVSGNSFNATLIKTPTYNSDNGGILNWNGVDQYATVPMSSTLRVTSITQEVWVYLSSTADQVFIGSQYGTGSNNSFALWISGGTFYFGVNTGGTFYASSFSTPSIGVWYHLVHTYGGSSQSLYINGSLIGVYSSAATGNIAYDVNNTKLAIGADFNGTGYDTVPTLFVNGKMPVVRIYNIALSAAQVLQNYNATKGRFGL